MKASMLTNEQVCSFCMAIAHLIHAGIDTADALTLLMEDEQDPNNRRLLQQMAKWADEGLLLSAVIQKSGAFPAYAATLTEVGEHSGKIEQTLQALARYYEGRDRMDRHLRTALLYPAALLGVLLMVAAVLLIWVLPVFNDVYARLGSSLTGFAGVLLTMGAALHSSLPVLLPILAALVVAFAVKPVRQWVLIRWNRLFGDRGAQRKVLSARFVLAVSMGISSGMTSQEALTLACKLSQGEAPAFAKRCEGCLQERETLAQTLFENGFLSPADRRLLDAGRRSGAEETVLQQIALNMQEQAREALERRAGLVEPAVVAAACVLIAAVLLSVMLPLMNIMNAIG